MVIVANNLAWDPDVAPRNVEALAAAVRAGEIAESRIDASCARIQELTGLRASR